MWPEYLGFALQKIDKNLVKLTWLHLRISYLLRAALVWQKFEYKVATIMGHLQLWPTIRIGSHLVKLFMCVLIAVLWQAGGSIIIEDKNLEKCGSVELIMPRRVLYFVWQDPILPCVFFARRTSLRSLVIWGQWFLFNEKLYPGELKTCCAMIKGENLSFCLKRVADDRVADWIELFVDPGGPGFESVHKVTF